MTISPYLISPQSLNRIDAVNTVSLSPISAAYAGYRILIADQSEGNHTSVTATDEFAGHEGEIAIADGANGWEFEDKDDYLGDHMVPVIDDESIWFYRHKTIPGIGVRAAPGIFTRVARNSQVEEEEVVTTPDLFRKSNLMAHVTLPYKLHTGAAIPLANAATTDFANFNLASPNYRDSEAELTDGSGTRKVTVSENAGTITVNEAGLYRLTVNATGNMKINTAPMIASGYTLEMRDDWSNPGIINYGSCPAYRVFCNLVINGNVTTIGYTTISLQNNDLDWNKGFQFRVSGDITKRLSAGDVIRVTVGWSSINNMENCECLASLNATFEESFLDVLEVAEIVSDN